MLFYGIFFNLCILVWSVRGVSSVLLSKTPDVREDGDRVKRSTECSESAKLTAVPDYAGMYGGKLIDLSGPCFSTSPQAYCKFTDLNDDQDLAKAEKTIYVNKSLVRCIVPRLLVRDRVILRVSTDNGHTYQYSTNFTIVFPGRMQKSDFVKNKGPWFFNNATDLELQWNNEWLSDEYNSLVDINLIGYKENDGKAMYKPLAILGQNISTSSGQYKFKVNSHQCKGQDCYDYDYEVALVEVRLQDKFTPTKYKFLTTNRVPLGWYVNDEMTRKYGRKDWPSSWCMNWYKNASKNMEWFDEILKCPCSLDQAMTDFGRWQPDTGCNLHVNTSICKYHHAAVHCVRSVQPVNGAGNQCCYSSKGYLVFAADTYFGSTADKGHDWGAAPYGKRSHVPILSHWVDDIIPLFTCCQWTDFKSCDYYVKLRGTTDCTEYKPPVPASVYGQGHIATFGGQKIRILAPDDYILLKAGNTEVQARFDNNHIITKNDLKSNTFTLTSVAVVNTGKSDVVEIRLLRSDPHKHGLIEVLLNGEVTEFKVHDLKWQDFKGLAVINTDLEKKNANFTVLLTNNIGFQVAAVAGTLQLDLMMPTDTYKTTSGLFGNIDGHKTLPDGTPFTIDGKKREEVYNNFEREWKVKINNLFSDDKTFSNSPVLNPEKTSVLRLQSTCTGSEECVFDYEHTDSQEIAMATKKAAKRYQSLTDNLVPIRSCGLLDVPRSLKSSYEYTIGTETNITGCRTGSLSGTSTYTCEETSSKTQAWSPAVTTKCVTEMESESSSNTGMVVGIVIAVLVVVAVIIIVVVIVILRKRQNKNRKDGAKSTRDEMDPMETK